MVWYHGSGPRKRRRPPTAKLGAVPTSVNRDTRPRSGTLVGAIEAAAIQRLIKRLPIRRAPRSVDAQHISRVTVRPRPHEGNQNHGAGGQRHYQQKG